MASFENYIDTIHALEGGYQDYESDKGNYNSRDELVGTNYGISAELYEDWLGYPPSVADMRAITPTIAKEIFRSLFWQKVRGNEIQSQAVAEIIVDHAINAGVSGASKLLQRTLNESFNTRLAIDGVIGRKTLGVVNALDPETVFKEYADARITFYEKLNNKKWFPIWKNRVKTIANKFGIALKKKD